MGVEEKGGGKREGGDEVGEKNANKKISNLELRTDTIHQKHIVYQYDTIYRNTVETEYIVISELPRANVYTSQNTYFNQTPAYSQRSNWVNTSHAPLTFAALKFLFEKEQSDINPLLAENDNLALGIPENIDENQPGRMAVSPFLDTQFAPLSYQPDVVDLAYLGPPADYMKVRKRPLRKMAKNLSPMSFQAGISGGLAFPQNKKISESKGYSFGVHGEMSFSKSLRLWLEATYYKVKFETHEVDRKLGVPILPSPSEEYVFSEAYVVDPFIQYNIGLQYLFYAHKKWRPYLGLGYSAASLLPYEIRYDFIHTSEEMDLSIQQDIDRNDFIMNMFLFNGGIEGELSKRLRFQLEGYYRWNGTNDGVVVPDILGVRSKFIYKF